MSGQTPTNEQLATLTMGRLLPNCSAATCGNTVSATVLSAGRSWLAYGRK